MMRDLMQAPRDTFRSVRFVLTDMDETLTHHGRLSARTYQSLERLQQAGIKVIPVTAAPAGWADQMARMWPVDGVICENGGLFLQRDGHHAVIRHWWHPSNQRTAIAQKLQTIAEHVMGQIPAARFADDQPFRQTSIAFAQPDSPTDQTALVAALRQAGADVTINNLWVLGWLGGYDKLTSSRRILADVFGVDIQTASGRDQILYCGDSTNDAPMFAFFRHTVGVSTVRHYLHEIPIPPQWITQGPGGDGFVEMVDAVLGQ